MIAPRYSWTQPLCFDCWENTYPSREPVKLREPELELCVECRSSTEDGIYIRIDPALAKYPTRMKK